MARVGPQHALAGGGPQAGPTGRIELFDDCLGVAGRLVRGDVAAHRRDRQHVELGRRQCQADRHGVVHAGVDVKNHLSGHPVSGQFPSAHGELPLETPPF